MRKKMIEVAIPLDAINEESARRKRKAPAGYPTKLHKWWAQRPIAACRAVLFTTLVDDPDSDPANWHPDGSVNFERSQERRKHLFRLTSDLITWENSTNERVLSEAKAEIAASFVSAKVFDSKEWRPAQRLYGETVEHFLDRTACVESVNALLAECLPPVLDPFCGGGSIPLEAQRLGLRTHASDLNPVPVLINKALLELPRIHADRPPINPVAIEPHKTKVVVRQKKLADREWRSGAGLAEDIRYYGQWMQEETHRRVGRLYPKVKITADIAYGRTDLQPYIGQEFEPVAWLWARTVRSPNPTANGEPVPLVATYWLSTKKGKEAWLSPVIDSSEQKYTFTVKIGSPSAEERKAIKTGTKTGRGCKFRCLLSDTPIPESHIKEQAKQGALGTRLLAIVIEGKKGRLYLPPVAAHEHTFPEQPDDVPACPEVPIAHDPRALWCLGYGLTHFAQLFTRRQQVLLSTLSTVVETTRTKVLADANDKGLPDAEQYANSIATYLAFVVSRVADYNCMLASWRPKDNAMRSGLSKQSLPMLWDFAEASPFASSSSGIVDCAKVVAECVDFLPRNAAQATVGQMDAKAISGGPYVICTDPPYYDNISYSDLSDFFYTWIRRTCGHMYPSLCSTVVAPKADEIIASPYRHGSSKEAAMGFFRDSLGEAFTHMARAADFTYPMTVFYAFKQAETGEDDDDINDDSGASAAGGVASTGWETMLEGLIKAGVIICGTWPMRTEGDNRQVGNDANALASSIVLVCRPRLANAPMVARRDFVGLLRKELPLALRELQRTNIAPVDLAQAAIGPGMAVYSRYSKVLESSGERLTVRTALALINQVLDEVLAEQEGDYDADTRWSLKWFEQFAHDDGPFGDANTLATAMSIGINGLVETGIVQAKAGKVRLLKRTELMNGRPETWDPATDTDIVHWEVCQYLIHALDTKGEAGAAALLRRINARYPGASETARELAYRLYTICERKKWAQEAMAYNSLIVAWPEIVKLAQSSDGSGGEAQTTMF